MWWPVVVVVAWCMRFGVYSDSAVAWAIAARAEAARGGREAAVASGNRWARSSGEGGGGMGGGRDSGGEGGHGAVYWGGVQLVRVQWLTTSGVVVRLPLLRRLLHLPRIQEHPRCQPPKTRPNRRPYDPWTLGREPWLRMRCYRSPRTSAALVVYGRRCVGGKAGFYFCSGALGIANRTKTPRTSFGVRDRSATKAWRLSARHSAQSATPRATTST